MCPKSSQYNESIAKEKDTKCPHCQLPCRGQKGVEAHLRRSKTCPGGNFKSKSAEGKTGEKQERKRAEKTEKTADKTDKKTTDKKTENKPAVDKTSEKKVADKKTADKKTEKKPSDKAEKKTTEKVEKKTEKSIEKSEKKLEKTPNAEKKDKKKTEKKTTEKAEKSENTIEQLEKKEKSERKERTTAAKDTKCEGCGLSFRGERGITTHQSTSTVCPKSVKYSKEAADAAKERLAKKQSSPLDTKCPHCETSHRGAKSLETHLAKSVTCPKSAKYDPNAKKE